MSSDFFAALRKVMSNIWSDGNEWQQTSWQWTMLSFVSLRNTVDVGEDTWEIQLEMFEKYITICWDGNEWKQMIWQWLVPLCLITATWLVKNCSLNLSLDNVWPWWRFCKYDIVFCILIQSADYCGWWCCKYIFTQIPFYWNVDENSDNALRQQWGDNNDNRQAHI